MRTLRMEKNMTKRDIVSSLPINYSTYANYESGFREPNSDVLQILARYFNVSIDFLMGMTNNRKNADQIAGITDDEYDIVMRLRALDDHGKDIINYIIEKEAKRINQINPEDQKKAVKMVNLGVYSLSQSKALVDYESNSQEKNEVMQFKASPASIRADFCIRISGEAMEPKINDGDIVFIKSTTKVEIDSIGVFEYKGEVFCRRLRLGKKNGGLFLEPINKSFAAKHIPSPDILRTIGAVLGIYAKSHT